MDQKIHNRDMVTPCTWQVQRARVRQNGTESKGNRLRLLCEMSRAVFSRPFLLW
jgi:hypothetical protein